MLHNGSKKILIITSEFPPDAGGIGNHAFNLALHLAEKNFIVTVLADIIHASQQEIENADWLKTINFFPVYRKNIVFLTYYRRIRKAIGLARNNDVIILSGKFSVWLTSVLKFLYARKKFIAVVHGTELQHRFVNFNLAKCDSVIAVSDFTRSLISPGVLKIVKCHTIPNGINVNDFSKIQIGQSKKAGFEILQLITIGSVTERKGQLNVINALPEIMKRFPACCYHIIGKPILKKELEEVVDQKNLNDHVIFHGAVTRKELIALLSKADIKLMLSNNTSSDVEGFGIAVLEANALGVPAIGSKKTGIEDAIRNNETGVLVDPKDMFEVAGAVEKILSNYDFFSANAKQWALQHDWKILVEKYIDVIEKVF